jgi:hypothetical protein
MNIKSIVIEGVVGDVQITGTPEGAKVTAGGRPVCKFARDESGDDRWAKVLQTAKAIYGTTPGGEVNATGSMVHAVLEEIERIS